MIARGKFKKKKEIVKFERAINKIINKINKISLIVGIGKNVEFEL